MCIKKFIFSAFLVTVLLLPATPAAAQSSDREKLLNELQSLLSMLISMQNQVAYQPANYVNTQGRSVKQKPRRVGLAPSTYYTGPYEAIYLVDGTNLSSYQNTVLTSQDQALWDLWTDVVGPRTVRTHIAEFRLYDDPDAEYDAFVEQLGESDDWIVGVNLAATSVRTQSRREAAIELFVHEYAHILYHYENDLRIEFEDTFWWKQSRNQRDYVSVYAMQNSEEDFAESFTHFVLYPKPNGNLIRNEKVLMFYEYEAMRDVREDIRDRLFD